jgi:hypothetical protein
VGGKLHKQRETSDCQESHGGGEYETADDVAQPAFAEAGGNSAHDLIVPPTGLAGVTVDKQAREPRSLRSNRLP